MLLSCGLLLLALPGGVAHAATTPVSKPPLEARLTACTTGLAPTARAATFSASMPAAKGTRRMTMRFRLLQRRGAGGRYKRVDVPAWASDVRSEPGRPGLIFTKRVEGLLAPAAYKAVVRFRWYDAKGRLQRETFRTTSACRQPDPRPDLVAGVLTGRVRDQDTAVYELVVRNDGRSVADRFAVELTIGDLIQPPIFVGPLAPGTAERGKLVGPRCRPGDEVRIELDPDGTVDEAVESDDVVVRPCPLPA